MRNLLSLLALLAAALPAQTLTAFVDDAQSHGAVGDGKLSLEEAIGVVNGTLALSALSPAERARIQGAGQVLDNIFVDAAITPTITIERQLSVMFGLAHAHADANLTGINGKPVLDGGSLAVTVLPLRTNHAHITNFTIRGGKVGIDSDATLHYHPGDYMRLVDVVFENQSEVALRLMAPLSPPAMNEPVELRRVTVRNAPIGLEILDDSLFGVVDVDSEDLRIEGCALGIHVVITGQGSLGLAELYRTTIAGAQNGVRVRRPTGSDAAWTLTFVHGAIEAAGSAIDVQGAQLGETVVAHHHLRLRAGGGALLCTPRTSRLRVLGSENVYEGAVFVQAGIASRKLWLHNNRFERGGLAIDNDGAAADLMWNTFTDVPVAFSASGRAAATLDSCELLRSPITNFGSAPCTLTNCWLSASAVTGGVSVQNPAPARWIGRASVTPADPALGGVVNLAVDLAPATAAAWFLGVAVPRPNTTAVPYRYYFDLAVMLALPVVFQNQDARAIPVPIDPNLVGLAVYAQPVAVPIGGQTWVPSLSFPIGGRFVIR
jgi:hypothetical protein